jgi:predicted glycosyltransferase
MDKQLSEFVSEPHSLMTYSHNGYGLGRLRRSTNIDHVPAAIYGELLPTLRMLKEMRSHKCESQ